MGGFGDVFAAGILGAIGGAGQGVADQALLEQKQQMQALRDERLSKLRMQEYAQQLQMKTDAAHAEEARQEQKIGDFFKSTTVPPTGGTSAQDAAESGGTLTEGQGSGTPPSDLDTATYRYNEALKTGNTGIINEARTRLKDVETQQNKAADRADKLLPKALAPEQAAYYNALTSRWNAEADAIRSGAKNKSVVPAIKVVKDDQNQTTYLVEEHTGAVGQLVPGEAATPAETHWFGANTSGKAATPAHIEWRTSAGDPLKGGLSDLYPSLSQRINATISSVNAPSAAKAGVVDSNRASGKITPASGDTAPIGYPDAKRAPDGNWYVLRNGQYFRVRQ